MTEPGYEDPEWMGSTPGLCLIGYDNTMWHLEGCSGHIDLPPNSDGLYQPPSPTP